MEEKIMLAVQDMENRIKWEKEDVAKYEREVREAAASYGTRDLVTFLPAKLAQLKESMDRLASYEEQKRMLEFIQK